MDTNEREQRIAALDARLRIESFVSECLEIAAPYLNDEDKVGWKPADALSFLISEVDPHFLSGRTISVSAKIPDTANPMSADYETLDWSPLGKEPYVNLKNLRKFWNSMGQLLHQDLRVSQFDIDTAKRRVAAANTFCDSLTAKFLYVAANLLVVERRCENGHITKRNANRMKGEQIIPCMDPNCRSVFIVRGTEPLVWEEFFLSITCDKCNSTHSYPSGPLIGMSYWEKASVTCVNENCDNRVEVRWVLSKAIR